MFAFMNKKCVIIDDDKVAIKVLEGHIEAHPNLSLSKSFGGGEEASNEIDKYDVDLIFLDVEMPKMDGFSFLKNRSNLSPFILVSQNKEYSFDAFEFNAIDFLAKPISYQRFEESIERFIQYDKKVARSKNDLTSIFVKHKRIWKRVKLDDIMYVKANNTFISIYASDQNYHINTSMKDFLKAIPDSNLIRIHRSFIVNINKIEEIDHEILKIGDNTIPISKTYMPELLGSLKFIK